jgi:hypothetical protein
MTNVNLDDEEVDATLERAAELEGEGEDELGDCTPERRMAPHPDQGWSPVEVEAIASQAGIDPSFVRAAMAQSRGGMASARVPRMAEWFSGAEGSVLRRRRIIGAPATEVSQAVASLVGRGPHPFHLAHADVAADGAEEVVLEIVPAAQARGSSVHMALLGAGIRRVHLSLRATASGSTEVVARGDWHGAVLAALACAAFLGALGTVAGVVSARVLVRSLAGGGSAGGLAGTLAGSVRQWAQEGSPTMSALAVLARVLVRALAHHGSPLGVVVALALFAFAAAAGTLGGVLVARACSLWSLRQAGGALGKLLDAIALDVRTHGRFTGRGR